ncbi:hypothetical protein IWQ61_005974 [Dispira simplex]|nr:hypothetical protein IWQ61_005974 [Dispira simplex]
MNLTQKNDPWLSELVPKCLKACDTAYVPYSKFQVGCALVARNKAGDERVFLGCNVENASLGATICAERTAMVKAISEGYTQFPTVMVTSVSSDQFVAPCGICRQFMREFGTDIRVILLNAKTKEFKSFTLDQLLPESFGPGAF